MHEEPFRIRDILLAVLFSLFAAALGLFGYLQPPAKGEMAVVFPPWTDERQIVQAIVLSGARIVGPTRIAGTYVAIIDSPEQFEFLHQSGAIFFTAARGICGPIKQAVLIKE